MEKELIYSVLDNMKAGVKIIQKVNRSSRRNSEEKDTGEMNIHDKLEYENNELFTAIK